ncbi:MAG TPA: helix-turn-helix domain-containing protein [Candidatus Megaira endosymbiont of Nemacystus decipiens]|nr:helix-turn-helix domain-containing protein [Candidatus Megaera endosymbiont of Nemacystus decipiens]
MTLSNCIAVCDAIVLLMDPLIEVVIHDITENNIIYLNGNLSNREVGELSLLEQNACDDIKNVVYQKTNFDGRLVKSISVKLEEKYLLCINCDVSIFSKIKELSSILVQKNISKQPKSIFFNDWQEKLNVTVNSYLQNSNLSLDKLRQQEKKALAKYLFKLGAFKEQNAATYVAKTLGLGRATIFKYLKEWRSE